MIRFVSLADLVFGKGRRLHSSVQMELHLLAIREKSKTLLFCVLGAELLSCLVNPTLKALTSFNCACVYPNARPPAAGICGVDRVGVSTSSFDIEVSISEA
jgi:hypothetical protein